MPNSKNLAAVPVGVVKSPPPAAAPKRFPKLQRLVAPEGAVLAGIEGSAAGCDRQRGRL
jgi:hypothetical protein